MRKRKDVEMEMDYVNGLIKNRKALHRQMQREKECEAAKREKQLNELRLGYRQRDAE